MNKFILKPLLFFSVFLLGAIAPLKSQDISVDDLSEQCIVNNGDVATFTFNVVPPNATDIVTDGSVNMTFDLYHSWKDDVTIVLCGPGGSPCATIKTDDTGGSDDLGNADGSDYDSPAQYTINDGGAGTLDVEADSPAGTYAPASPFSTFNGITAQGIWSLTFSDDAGGDDGCMRNVTLEMDVEASSGGPTNDNCASPTALTVGAINTCSNTAGTNVGATASGETPNPSCSLFGTGEDVWYSVVVPCSGNLTIEMSDAGGPNDWAMAVYSGTCGSLTQVACDDDSNDAPNDLFPKIELTGQTGGATFLVRVWEYDNDETGQFNICAYETPRNLTPSCGDIVGYPGPNGCGTYSSGENISWVFTPNLGEYASITFTYVDIEANTSSCPWDAINITTPTGGNIVGAICGEPDGDGGVGSGLAPGDCFYNPVAGESITITFTSDGTVQETGFTFTCNCDATTPGVCAGGTALPVELTSFKGEVMERYNMLTWETASEENTEWHIIERSVDTREDWAEVGRVPAIGFSEDINSYYMEDDKPLERGYYRLKTVDFDGKVNYSDVILLKREKGDFAVLSVTPNPAKSIVSVAFQAPDTDVYTIKVNNLVGQLMLVEQVNLQSGIHSQDLDISGFANGIYLISIENANESVIHKVVKQ